MEMVDQVGSVLEIGKRGLVRCLTRRRGGPQTMERLR